MEQQNEPCCEDCGTTENLLTYVDPFGIYKFIRCEACNENVAMRAMEREYEG